MADERPDTRRPDASASGARERDGREDAERSGREPVERREVRSRDPSLSPEANRVLTDELRAVVGSDTVEVPVDRAHAESDRHGARPGPWVGLIGNRLILAVTFLGALVVGAILSLITGSWWFLLLALAVHAVTTIAIVGLVIVMTRQTEHLSPSAAARLEDEGVSDPDAVFTELVHEFRDDDQRSAITPSPHRGRPVGPGSEG